MMASFPLQEAFKKIMDRFETKFIFYLNKGEN